MNEHMVIKIIKLLHNASEEAFNDLDYEPELALLREVEHRFIDGLIKLSVEL